MDERLRVSILTRPEGRVQLEIGPLAIHVLKFQSSPVPKDGCNTTPKRGRYRTRVFQSSPVPKDGCNPDAG